MRQQPPLEDQDLRTDPRYRPGAPFDPRSRGGPFGGGTRDDPRMAGGAGRPGPPAAANPVISAQDQEKAALIMQVLQLSDQQIALLPPDQRQSIMVLKEQIARSTQHLHQIVTEFSRRDASTAGVGKRRRVPLSEMVVDDRTHVQQRKRQIASR
ncbi:uncharacterized protein LOC144134332 [Amblyomma americanum]